MSKNTKTTIAVRQVIDALTLTEEMRAARLKEEERLLPGQIPFAMNHIITLRNAGKDVFLGDPSIDPLERFAGYKSTFHIDWAQRVIAGFKKVVADHKEIDFTPTGNPKSIKADVVGIELRLNLESIATLPDGTRLYLYYHVKSELDDFVRNLLLHGAKYVAELSHEQAEVAIVDAYNGRLIRLNDSADGPFVEACVGRAAARYH